MTRKEWRFVAASVIFILAAGIFYLLNIDIYRLSGNYLPVQGIMDFYEEMKDADYLEEHYPDWEHSDSPALHSLYRYICSTEDEDVPLTMVAATPIIAMILNYVVIAFLPFYVLVAIRIHQRKRKEWEEQREEASM